MSMRHEPRCQHNILIHVEGDDLDEDISNRARAVTPEPSSCRGVLLVDRLRPGRGRQDLAAEVAQRRRGGRLPLLGALLLRDELLRRRGAKALPKGLKCQETMASPDFCAQYKTKLDIVGLGGQLRRWILWCRGLSALELLCSTALASRKTWGHLVVAGTL